MYIISSIKQNKKEYEIIINGNKRLIVSRHIFFSLNIKENQEVDIKTLLYKVRTAQQKESVQRAVYMISLKDRTEVEIIKFLKKQNYADSIIKYAIDKLKSLNLLDDERYIERFINMRLESGYGNQRIIQDLIKKGFDKNRIENAISNSNYEDIAVQKALIYAKKYATRFETLDYNNLQKLKMALIRRGYSYATVNAVANMIKES